MAYRPRARKGSLIARTRTWPSTNLKEPTLLGFMAFKAASLHVLSIDDQEKSPTFGQMVSNHSTVDSCAPVIIDGIRSYYDTIDGLKVFSEVYREKLPKELSRKKELKCNFQTQFSKIEKKLSTLDTSYVFPKFRHSSSSSVSSPIVAGYSSTSSSYLSSVANRFAVL